MDNPREQYPKVFDFILSEETDYKTRKIPLGSNWNWNMYKHVDMSFMLKNSQFTQGDNESFSRPYNNIIIPIANVNYRTEGFDVKDAELYVDDPDNHHLSLLARKYHAKWAIENSVDTVIDESVESYFDYGLTLVKNVNDKKPEVVPLQSLAFVDQTDVLAGPICIKHNYSIDQLLEFKGKWDDEAIDKAILMAKFAKTTAENDAKTPGKYVEVYELHGMFPESWLKDGLAEDTGKYSPQIHIVTYYVDESNKKNGIHLFKGKEPKPIFKALKRDPIFGRACGRGGIEELFHAQIWTNYDEIHIQQMLEATSKVITKTTDPKIARNNNFGKLKHGSTVKVEEGKMWEQMNIQPINKAAFDQSINKWEQRAAALGSASDPQLGKNPTSGTPLGTTEIVVQQGEGVHDYRQGKIAVFWGEIYRDWTMKALADDMARGDRWLDELSLEELQEVSERVVTNASNRKIVEMILAGRTPTPDDQNMLKSILQEEFMKGGKKRFLEIMKDEIAGLPLKVKFSIAGKQKNLAETASKLNSVFRGIFANPQILQVPGMDKLFNSILENSGFSPIDFSSLTASPLGGGVPSPMQGEINRPVSA